MIRVTTAKTASLGWCATMRGLQWMSEMKPLAIVGAPAIPSFRQSNFLFLPKQLQSYRFSVSCTPSGSRTEEQAENTASSSKYKPGVFDDLFLNLFRDKLVKEVGWDSEKPGYDGLIEVANHLMTKGRTRTSTIEAAVRILRSLFPPFLLELYKMLIAPIRGGKVAAMMVARVTAVTCQWLMGPCKVNSVDLPNGTSCSSGVYVERCKYLEESKCIGICINTCKFPTQTFFKDHMGVPLLMEPNFSDYSCQFKFGVLPPLPEDDSVLKEPCLEACPNAAQRRIVARKIEEAPCPKT